MANSHIIPKSAFQNRLFSEHTIPEGTTQIGDYAFYRCIFLKSVSLPDSVCQIGNYVFSHCRELRHARLSRSLTTIPRAAFLNCAALEEITIPPGVAEIGSYAFQRCLSLRQLLLPEGLRSIGAGAFSDCTALTEVTIPQGITELKQGAFSGCSSLSRVVIPESVHTIHHYAFSGCSNLTEIVCHDPTRFAEAFAFTPYWQAAYPGFPVHWHLPLELTGTMSGKYLVQRGYSQFDPEREYHIEIPGDDGVVQVSSWCGDDGPDEDGFGREEYYDWWLLDEHLNPIPGIPIWHSYSRLDMRNHEAQWASLRKKAAELLKNSK